MSATRFVRACAAHVTSAHVTSAALVLLAPDAEASRASTPMSAVTVGLAPTLMKDTPRSWWERTDPSFAAPGAGRGLPTSRHFVIRSDLPRDRVQRLAAHLDGMFAEYVARLASLTPRREGVFNVYIFASQDDYVATLGSRFGVNAAGSGGMFFVTPEAAGLAFFVDGVPQRSLEHIVQHEAFHQIAYSRFGAELPMWVNEGLAEYFGAAAVIGDRLITGEMPQHMLDRVREAVEQKRTIPFLEILMMTQEAWNGRVASGMAGIQYDQAWAMVQFLVEGDGARYRGAFERYLRLINAGTDPTDAFMRAFQVRDAAGIAEFEARWRSWIMTASPGAMITALDRAMFLAEGLLELKRRGQTPTTIEELRTMLRAIDFSLELIWHGRGETLSAADDLPFTIPGDRAAPVEQDSRDTARFALEPAAPDRSSLAKQAMEKRDPTPASIVTIGLPGSHQLVVGFERAEDGAWRAIPRVRATVKPPRRRHGA